MQHSGTPAIYNEDKAILSAPQLNMSNAENDSVLEAH
jgi:hypothetical protein